MNDGSTINVYPFKVLAKLKIEPPQLVSSNVVVHAYNDSKSEVVNVFKTGVKVALIETKVEFTILDIFVVFSLLLGRV